MYIIILFEKKKKTRQNKNMNGDIFTDSLIS